MIRIAFKVISFFWIISPALFVGMRGSGLVNYQGIDWLIFAVLALISTFVCFLNYKGDE